jgi:2'-5' RNA ligase
VAEPGFSALVVPVPELDAVLRPRAARLPPETRTVDPEVLLAHITLLAPFAPRADLTSGVVGQLAAFFGDVVPFRFSFGDVSRFPGGTYYLPPEPSAPFRQLTHELWRRFPEYPPYEGRFDDVVPHLTIPTDAGAGDGRSDGAAASGATGLDTLQRELAAWLPVTAYAREVWLVWAEPDASSVLETFPFGVAAA